MDPRRYSLIAAITFTVIAFLQLSRVVLGWPLTAGGYPIPLWANWLGCFVAVVLAWLGYAAWRTQD